MHLMLVILTDFGATGPYAGQVKAVLAQQAHSVPVIDLFLDLPAFDPSLAAALIPSYGSAPFPYGSVFFCVVDPGVGTERRALAVSSSGYWYVGPDNGLLSRVVDDDPKAIIWGIDWIPDIISATFHGRDLFAPVAAALACGFVPGPAADPPLGGRILDCGDIVRCSSVSGQAIWSRVVYVDHYGNAMTGIRGRDLDDAAILKVRGWLLRSKKTFGAGEAGVPFWYINSNGLVEMAVRNGSAASLLGLQPGTDVIIGSVYS